MNKRGFQKRTIFLIAYLIFALLPIYWMVNMSLKTNEEILASFSLWPAHVSWASYRTSISSTVSQAWVASPV